MSISISSEKRLPEGIAGQKNLLMLLRNMRTRIARGKHICLNFHEIPDERSRELLHQDTWRSLTFNAKLSVGVKGVHGCVRKVIFFCKGNCTKLHASKVAAVRICPSYRRIIKAYLLRDGYK